MQKNKQIKALFFLGVFSLLLLHHVFPHFHHQHEVVKTTKTHSHDHHHHHDTPDKDKSSKDNLINFLLGMHVHGFTSDEIPLIRNIVSPKKTDENVAVNIHTSTYFVCNKDYGELEIPSFYDPPNNYSNPYFDNLNSRGPPVLG